MPDLPPDLQRILRDSFFIRTTLTRRDGSARTIETTYYWDGAQSIVLSGYPGKRDWVASMARAPVARSSAGWKMNITRPGRSCRTLASADASPSPMATCTS